MDLGSTLIVAVILVISTLPFIVLRNRNAKKEKIKLQTLNQLAHQQNCKIKAYNSSGDFTIGLDDNKQMLFFCKKNKMNEYATFIDLTTIKKCSTMVNKNKSENKNIEFIESISLYFKTKENTNTSLEFYNEEFGDLVDELALAYQWEKQINKLIV